MTEDFKIELFDNTQDPYFLAKKLSVAFPQRSAEFFLKGINKLNSVDSCLCILKLHNTVVGSVFLYNIYGYPGSVWSPSYLFVDKIARGLSLIFLMNSLRKRSRLSLDVSPTNEVKTLLSGLKFKQINNGSLLIPLLIQRFPFKSRYGLRNYLEISSSPSERFKDRADLIWYRYNQVCSNGSVCVKKTSRMGLPFFILVYFPKDHFSAILPSLVFELSGINIFSTLVIPDFNLDHPFYSIKTCKFHSFSNFHLDLMYSILGSEVTELI